MKFKEFNWKLPPQDRDRAEAVIKRAIDLAQEDDIQLGDKSELLMDLIACHNHACPLDFEKMLRADDFNLLHDMLGIRNCLNRTTGQLENNFLPRCARPQG